MKSNLQVKDLINHFSFKLFNENSEINRVIEEAKVLVPGLELAGFGVENNKNVILLGKKECHYIYETKCFDALNKIIGENTPCIVVSNNEYSDKIFVDKIKNVSKIPVLFSDKDSGELLVDLYYYLIPLCAPSELVHGTLISVFGTGVMLVGDSGIGKSEIALNLVKKGHRLVADDSVITYKLSNRLYGRPVEHQKNIIEVRGLGLVDVFSLFGINAVLETKTIDLVIQLVSSEETVNLDRLSDPLKHIEINGMDCPSVILPLNKARNIVDIIEIAVMDYKNRLMGHSATLEYIKKHDKLARGEE